MSYFLFALYLLLTYVRVTDYDPELAQYRIMLWLGVLSLVVAVVAAIFRRRVQIFSLPVLLFVGLAASIALSVLAQGWVGGAINALVSFGTTAGLIFFLIALNVDSRRRLAWTGFLLVAFSLVLVGQSFAAIHFDYMRELLVLEAYVDGDGFGERIAFPRVRSVGFLNDPNDLALALLTMLPILGLAWNGRSKFRSLLVVALPWLAIMYCILLTRSRGALIGLVIVFLMTFRNRIGSAGSAVVTICMVVALLAMNLGGGRSFSSEDESAYSRLDAWGEGISMLRDNPLTGVGFGQFLDHHERTAHSSIVLCFSELGLGGYFWWLALLVVVWLGLGTLARIAPTVNESDSWLPAWAEALRVSLTAFFVSALFLSRTYATTLYILLGLAVALLNLAKKEGYEVDLPASRWLGSTGAIEFASIAFVYVAIHARY